MHDLFEQFMQLGVSAEELELEYIEYVLKNAETKSEAYEILQVHRKTVYNRLKKARGLLNESDY